MVSERDVEHLLNMSRSRRTHYALVPNSLGSRPAGCSSIDLGGDEGSDDGILESWHPTPGAGWAHTFKGCYDRETTVQYHFLFTTTLAQRDPDAKFTEDSRRAKHEEGKGQ